MVAPRIRTSRSPYARAAIILSFVAFALYVTINVSTMHRGLKYGVGNVQSRGRVAATSMVPGKKLLVLGGSGFVGREVCKRAIDEGFQVTSLSRRGENPLPGDEKLSQVAWIKGNALDQKTVDGLVKDADAVVHSMGLLFDVNSGLTNLNLITSGSRSVPDESSTYDNITRRTAENALNAIKSQRPIFGAKTIPFAFVSAAEAGWPDVQYGPQVEASAPDWLKRYLIAKRNVEFMMEANKATIRPIIYRPSLIWNWGKLDVLPIIPIFNAANALGVPFVDKTVRVETLAQAIVEGIKDDGVRGVQRFPEMEELAA
mmetsp:Transcript_9879/g.14864  ORF Transcript_9879/g.14864 Transcript_9879/m.14864 type:complete len:315 (-) Transcript_9879:145-1089(-)|eukprot:CAMPEP_0167752244 /NCGR_PEP_ID=MMETSP0110_2-20121227/7027_1 /TAXON_ID=629695 /ORGANISM="Gymnochlora sp., Strain CCMP2014" /LENGTH=314 /DNA_ID=CAMNT_0007637831 /DNA_START=215 /DNA_END=1159 /DNA_ORIENTATION=-